ncbi:hypothetical protein [uncultured Tenacibaculum sp.]|uniref:hypothetical protein n=1 Tax=uncultured Tenacibaculum sp. TaxID=174713 RepID=UPI0026359AD6|nr:hypothetical protein [uncultured Tenacibaculum sp.]
MNFIVFIKPKNQLLFSIILSSFILLIISIFEYYNYPFEELTNKDFKEISLIQIQINTVTIGLFSAFFFFWSQSLENIRNTSYFEFRSTINKITDFYSNLPEKYNDFEKPLINLLMVFNNIKENDFPLKSENLKIIKKTAKKTVKLANKYNDNKYFNLLWILSELEHYINKIGVCFVTFTIMSVALKCIKKQVSLLISLIIAVIFCSFINPLNYKVLIIITTITLTLTIASICELLYFIKYYYKNLDAAWHKKE